MDLFPHFPIHLNSLTVFGLTLLLGLIGGEIAKRLYFLPIISGYIAIGFAVGPGGFNIVNPSVLAIAHIFVEISLSLVLFELGRHLNFRWLYRDYGLLFTAITESSLTFAAIFSLVHWYIGLAWLQSALAGTIAIATSPAVVMMVAHDLSSEGPVTRRTLILTSLNNLFALVIFTLLLPLVQADHLPLSTKVAHAVYRLSGSVFLGFMIFLLAEVVAYLTGKNKQNQFVLFVSLVMLAIGLSYIFNLSSMLMLFTLGIAARNFDYKHLLMEIDFEWLARVFFILLFVATGVHLKLHGLLAITIPILFFILVRGAAKTISIFLFSHLSNLTQKQSLAISFALSPMAGVAIGMSNILADFNPDFGHRLLLIITGVLTVLNILGPIATQIAFVKTGETAIDRE
jgi:Kef-type K+ transport system membrane component KefB